MQFGPPMRPADFLLLHNIEIIILEFLVVDNPIPKRVALRRDDLND
jgi:hypothetical protein